VQKARIASISAEQDEWLRRAFAAAVAAAKDLVDDRGPIRSNIAIGRLGDSEWKWIVSAAVSAWVAIRSEQAAAEGWDLEQTIRMTRLEPCPWDTGAVIKILPQLAQARGDFDWSLPVGSWSKEALAGFLLAAFNLIQRATIARDVVEEQLAGKPTSADATARQVNAASGNPRITPAELKALSNEDCPF
jgi:hypothetical protein